MKNICASCHSIDWAEKQFARLDHEIEETDRMVRSATELLLEAWEKGLAEKTNPFDESIEQDWVRQWLFYANSVRYAAAMMGPDYSTFKLGWWELTNNLQKMSDKLELMKSAGKEKEENSD